MTNIEKNPFTLFDIWFKEAKKAGNPEPEAVNLATASKDGRPSNRMVLLKGYSDKGFVFFTNLESKKGKEISENPFVSMCFFWPEIDRQVRIEGEVKKVLDQEADEYFNSRPLNSQIGATISKQSRPILENDFSLFTKTALESFKILASSQKITRPQYWSGFTLIPDRIEFWQKGDFRIHKRISYSRKSPNQNWETTFLYP